MFPRRATAPWGPAPFRQGLGASAHQPRVHIGRPFAPVAGRAPAGSPLFSDGGLAPFPAPPNRRAHSRRIHTPFAPIPRRLRRRAADPDDDDDVVARKQLLLPAWGVGIMIANILVDWDNAATGVTRFDAYRWGMYDIDGLRSEVSDNLATYDTAAAAAMVDGAGGPMIDHHRS
eukprot:gene45647-31276_t